MTDRLEQFVREVAPAPGRGVDVAALRAEASARARRRRVRTVVVSTAAVVVVAALAVAGWQLRGSDAPPAGSVRLPRSAAVTWSSQPGVAGMRSFASGPAGTVAVGTSNQQAAIWFSTDGTTWNQVYEHPAGVSVPCAECKAPVTNPTYSAFSAVEWLGGRWIAYGSEGQPQRGLVLSSTDGTTWTQADPAGFTPTTTKTTITTLDPQGKRHKITMGVQSFFRDVIYADGRYVGIGDLYTANAAQQAGLSPAIWTSRDAVHWQHHVLKLGDGYDPYQESITWRAGQFVATGRIGKFPAVAWTSTDLRRWDAHEIQGPTATARVVVTPHGYVAYGSISENGRSIDRTRSWPALWYSQDGARWRRTLKLSPSTSVHGGFAAVGQVDGAVVAVGSRGSSPAGSSDPDATTFVYLSTDGRHWSVDQSGTFASGTSVDGSGTVGGDFAVASSATIRRAVAASVDGSPRRVTVRAGPGLAFGRAEYFVPAGDVVVELAGAPGMTLGFDDPRFRTCVLGTDPGGHHQCHVHLEPGRYVIASTIEGHRAAGLVATLVVLPAS